MVNFVRTTLENALGAEDLASALAELNDTLSCYDQLFTTDIDIANRNDGTVDPDCRARGGMDYKVLQRLRTSLKKSMESLEDALLMYQMFKVEGDEDVEWDSDASTMAEYGVESDEMTTQTSEESKALQTDLEEQMLLQLQVLREKEEQPTPQRSEFRKRLQELKTAKEEQNAQLNEEIVQLID